LLFFNDKPTLLLEPQKSEQSDDGSKGVRRDVVRFSR
jgi:hypothetical protein